MDNGTEHYLKRELYDLVRRDGAIFEFLQSGSLDGLWFWDIEHPEEEWLSPRFKEVFGYADHEVPNTSAWWQQNIFPEDLPLVHENFRRHCADPGHPYDQIVRYRHKNGSTVWIRCRGTAIRDGSGKPIRMLGAHTDVTAIVQAEQARERQAALQGQKQILELVALGEPLANTLDALVRFLEAQSPDMICSILLLDADGQHLRHGAAPSLPADYRRAIDGAAIGPCAGSCGTAAFRGEPVLVADIEHDPLWADYRQLALPHGLKACWSTPILDGRKRVLGTFAVYYRELGLPKPYHRELIDFATHTAAICISRQRVESALAQSEARYALAVRGTNDGLWDWDIATGKEYRSSRWKELRGYADEELPDVADSDFSRILHPDDRAPAQSAVQAHLERRAPYDCDLRLQTKSGDYRWFRCRGQAEWNPAGQPVRMAGSITDITERKRAQAALRDFAEFNRQIVASADDGIVVLDRDLRYTVWNHFMEELMGRRAEEVLGRHPEEIFPWVRKGGQLAAIQRALAGETVAVPNTMRIKTAGKRIRWVRARVSALRTAQGEIVGVIVTIIDLTESKLAEEGLRRSHEQMRALAARLQSVREEQSAQIAREIHDVLGQQLTALKLDLAWLKRRLAAGPDSDGCAALLDKLGAATGLVDTTILTVQKIATELRPGLLDKLGLAAALEHEARDFARRAGLKCAVELEAGLVASEKKQAIEVFRVAQEMMTNIARHAKAKRFAIRLSRAGDQAVLAVSDDGRGIKPRELDGAKSLGVLGMRERAELLGGTLELRGAPGAGTTAVLTFPIQPAP